MEEVKQPDPKTTAYYLAMQHLKKKRHKLVKKVKNLEVRIKLLQSQMGHGSAFLECKAAYNLSRDCGEYNPCGLCFKKEVSK